ncbi:MAG: peptidase M61 [Bacteroidetes bacterium]|nr:peptidase M61 [Bacteroidota bacterium]
MRKLALLLSTICLAVSVSAVDNAYHFSIDLTKTPDHKLSVEVTPPQLNETQVIYSLPKMVPGTYSIYDFGRFVEDFKAFDQKGSPLQVTHIDTNSWRIQNANTLGKITYRVRDTYHASKTDNPIFEPAGSDFQPDTCFVLNFHTMIGYFRGHNRLYYELNIKHAPNFYGSTSLVDRDNSETQDQYIVPNYNEVVDNPVMYTVPDTAHLKIGESDVLVSVFSPGKTATAAGIAKGIDTLLQAQGKYLGGKLPVPKYSFLIYLSDHDGLTGGYGALEHSYGSMYYLIDGTDEKLASTVRNVASHEFFHIMTPLNIHSEEIANFDFDNAKMSEHLWLYEGSTEYHAHSVQVRYGLISPEEYLSAIRQEMNEAQFAFNDSLSFTELSLGALDKYKDQYANVYAKGALISLCLDLKLIKDSEGKYRLMDLINDLAKTYGKDKAFKDTELFDKIYTLTKPDIKDFIENCIIGNKPLPFKEVLDYAGVNYTKVKTESSYSFGGFGVGYNQETQRLIVGSLQNLNAFGRKMGYQEGDEILSVNGKKLTAGDFSPFRAQWLKTVKDGDKFKMVVLRKAPNGKLKKKTLQAKVFKAETHNYNLLSFAKDPTAEQLKIRKAWLEAGNN